MRVLSRRVLRRLRSRGVRTVRKIESVELLLRVAESDSGAECTFVLRRYRLGFPGDSSDWANEVVTDIPLIHSDDVHHVFDRYGS